MSSTGKTLLHVAWIAILLGLVAEAGVLLVATAYGKELATRPILADVVQKVSWSVIVCVGLALGRGATRMVAMRAGVVMGLAGLLAAPLAFAAARALHEGIQEALAIKVLAGGGGSPVLIALVKGLEYAALGAALAWLARRGSGAGAHAGMGFLCGVVFGGALLGILIADAAAAPPAGALISRGLNELINPTGCALTLYAAELLGRRGATVTP